MLRVLPMDHLKDASITGMSSTFWTLPNTAMRSLAQSLRLSLQRGVVAGCLVRDATMSVPSQPMCNPTMLCLSKNFHVYSGNDYNEDGYPRNVHMQVDTEKPVWIILPNSKPEFFNWKVFIRPFIKHENLGRLVARFWLALAVSSVGTAPTFAADLQLNIDNVPTAPSRMFVALYDSAESMKENKPSMSKIVDVTSNQTIVVFPALDAGTYAFVAFADENSNGKLDTNFIGIPTERYGFSNNAMGLMGPPSFDAASVRVENERKTIAIKLR